MKQRNWLDLSRKLVDRFDLDFTLSGMSQILGEYALSFFGEGVMATTQFPNPFPIVLSPSVMGGTVGTGIAYDPSGNFTAIQTGTPAFTIPTSHPTLVRWDLLVIQYKQTGDTLIPKPSDPLTMINLNLHDDFNLVIIPGTPSLTPAYPAKGVNDVILAGIRVPAASTLGNQCSVDLTVRELGFHDVVKYPDFVQESLTGTIDGINTIFTISQAPILGSLIVFTDGGIDKVLTEYTLVGTTITFATPPVVGQSLYAWYVVMDASSTNPLAVQQETPGGVIDGTNDTFSLVGNPANKISTLLFVDGIVLTQSEWTLLQAPTGSFVKFASGSVPKLGQSIYCVYFVNPASVGIAPVITGPGGGSLTPYGSIGTPLLIDPTVGITANNVRRQVQFVKSLAGASLITANPQISAGFQIGDELYLAGVDDVNYIILDDGNGTIMNGPSNITRKQTQGYFWTGTGWKELGRVV